MKAHNTEIHHLEQSALSRRLRACLIKNEKLESYLIVSAANGFSCIK